MKILDSYLKLQQEIFDYFGYIEDWRVISIEDSREYFWQLSGESYGDSVRFAETIEPLEDEEDGEYYSNEIYTQRHLPKWVYRGMDFTMVVVDTHCDGNQFLQIFDNSREVK